MPHIRAIYPETISPQVRLFLEKNKGMICEFVSNTIGYEKRLIALIPERIPKADMDMAENVLPLELVVEAGIKIPDHDTAERCSERIKQMILEHCDGAEHINFGVWVRAYHVNGYTEHKPAKTKKYVRRHVQRSQR